VTILDAIAPASWWDSPASLTGRHHPPGQTQRMHAIGTLRAARWLWRRVPWQSVRRDKRQRRSMLIAALIHDCGKSVDRAEHETAGALMALQAFPNAPMVAYLVLHHMGRFGVTAWRRSRWMIDHGIIELDTPRARWIADLLQNCDYCSAFSHRLL
jgi:hypothetical protein